MPLKDINSK